MVCTLLAGVNVVAFAADDNDLIVSVHCFYNDALKGGDGEHLYTKDADEMSWLSGLPTWDDQDEAWKAPVSSSLAIYRVFNSNSGEHHYAAADEAEWLVSQGWTQEKIAFYSDDNKGVAIYRLWNGGEGVGSHYYTTDEGEKDFLVAAYGWKYEGVNFYGVKEEQKSMTAAQTSAKEITVTSVVGEFTGLETFTVSHGDVADELADLEYDEELDVYTITLADPIVDAVYTVTCSDTDFAPVTFEGEEYEGLEILSAEQTGANTIEFTLNRAIKATDDVDLLNGTTEQEMSFIPTSEDGKTIEITTVAKLSDAAYTIVVTPEDELLPATEEVTCQAEKLAGLAFGPGLAFVSNTNFYTVATTLNGANQWGEEFNLTSGTMKVYPGVAAYDDGVEYNAADYPNVAVGFKTGYDADKKQYVLAKKDTIPFKVGDTVTMTAVFNDGNGNVIQETDELPILNVPQVSSMTFGELTPTSPKLIGERVTVDNFKKGGYYFPVEAYDQYGNKLDKDSLNYALLSSMLFVNPAPENSTFGGFGGFDELEDGTVIMKVASSGAKQMPGKGTITVSGIGGLSTSASYEVEDNPYIASLTMVGLGTVIEQTPAKFGLYAVDQYGEEFNLYDTVIKSTGDTITFEKSVNGLSGQVASIKVNNGGLQYAKQSSTGQVAFLYTSEADVKNDVFTLTTSIPTVTTVPITVKEAGKPASIKSELRDMKLTVNPYTRLVRDKSEAEAVINAKTGAALDLRTLTQSTTGALVIVDSNGVEMTAPNVPYATSAGAIAATNYGYTIEPIEGNTSGEITVTGGMVTGITKDTKFKVTLYYHDATAGLKTLDTEEFKIKFTSGNYDGFAAVWADNYDVLYSGSQTDAEIEVQHVKVNGQGQSKMVLVYGTDEYGLTALLPTTEWELTCGDGNIDTPTNLGLARGVAFKDTKRVAYAGTPATLLEGDVEFAIWADSSDDDTVDEIVDTLDTSYSNVTPKAQYWAWTATNIVTKETAMADDTIQVTTGTSVFVKEAQNVTPLSVNRAGFMNAYSYSLAAIDQYGLPLAGVITYSLDGAEAKASTDSEPSIATWTAGSSHVLVASCDGLKDKTITLVVPY